MLTTAVSVQESVGLLTTRNSLLADASLALFLSNVESSLVKQTE